MKIIAKSSKDNYDPKKKSTWGNYDWSECSWEGIELSRMKRAKYQKDKSFVLEFLHSSYEFSAEIKKQRKGKVIEW